MSARTRVLVNGHSPLESRHSINRPLTHPLPTRLPHPPVQVILMGAVNKHNFMGVYCRCKKEVCVAGYPIFECANQEGSQTFYLYRAAADSRWKIVDRKKYLNSGKGYFRSTPAELPTEEGVEWQCWEDMEWKIQESMECVEVCAASRAHASLVSPSFLRLLGSASRLSSVAR